MSFTFKETEEKIKKYYDSLRVLGQLKHKLEVYRRRKEDIERKIENSVIRLEDNFKALSYDGVGGGSGNKRISPQERAVDKAFLILERNLEDVKAEILLIEEQISGIETENADMEYILKDIDSEYVNILESLFKYKKGAVKVSVDCNMDRATIYRKKDKVIKEVMKWLNFYS